MAQSSNQYDIRDSLKKMREWQAKAQAQQGTVPTPPKFGQPRILKEDIAGLPNQDFQAEKEAFQQAVPAQVEFKNYVGPEEGGGNVIEIRGVLKIGGAQGLQFLMTTKNDDGLYFNCTEFQADETAIDVISKLRAYYDVWYGQSLEKLNK
jgi:hypothetical protein